MTTPQLVVDAEVVPAIDHDSAVEMDARIRDRVGRINCELDELQADLDMAKHSGVHAELGFASWTAYFADVFTVKVRLDRDRRRELVGYLSGEGMSQRAIAEVIGVGQKTVSRDLNAGESNDSPEPDRSVADKILDVLADDADALADELIAADPTPAPRPTITGLDGKTYQPPRPKPQPPTEEQLIAHHEAEKLAAQQETFNRWSRAVDGLTNALSYAKTFVPPAGLPSNYVSVEEFKTRLAALVEISNQWKECQ